MDDFILNKIILSGENNSKIVILRMYLGDISDRYIVKKYNEYVTKQQKTIFDYLDRYSKDSRSSDNPEIYTDAGFDLFVPHDITFYSNETQKIDMGIRCSMTYNNIPCSYYMYPRSSTGSKTPLRLANSVGIIDSGYRGSLISVFDNIKASTYDVKMGDRLVQICSGNLLCPIFPIIVNDITELGITERGQNGFGSSGK